MIYDTIQFDITDGLATVRMNRPEVMNALNTQMRAEITDAMRIAGREARVAVLTLLGERLESAHPDAIAKDAKTRLQEFLQGRRRGLPEYEVVAVGGTDHAREFRVLCRLSDAEVQQAEGTGASRRAAEQQAAAVMLDLLEETPS